MKILLIVNCSPWGSTLGVTALRFAHALVAEGMAVTAVFFREDGVYHAVGGRAADAGTPALDGEWLKFSNSSGAPLLLCSSSSQRRLPAGPVDGFREAGLPGLMELMAASDRVISW